MLSEKVTLRLLLAKQTLSASLFPQKCKISWNFVWSCSYILNQQILFACTAITTWITPLRLVLWKAIILIYRNSTSRGNVLVDADLLCLPYAPLQSRITDWTTSMNIFFFAVDCTIHKIIKIKGLKILQFTSDTSPLIIEKQRILRGDPLID